MSTIKLTPTSYLVLGLAAQHGPVTPYDLKRLAQSSIGYFWSFPHSQLYAEPARLAEAGLLREEREESGRRKRRYTVTRSGRRAVADWLREPVDSLTEIRDLGLLKLSFGSLADGDQVAELARQQAQAHAQRREIYRALQREIAEVADPHARATLEMGLRFEAMAGKFWADVAAGRMVEGPARARSKSLPRRRSG